MLNQKIESLVGEIKLQNFQFDKEDEEKSNEM